MSRRIQGGSFPCHARMRWETLISGRSRTPGSGPPVDISGPGFPCSICMEERDLVAVAECVGDKWRRCDGQLFLQGSVSCAEQFNSEAPEPVHDGVGVEVLACPDSGEEPGAFRTGCCSEIGAVPDVLA